MINVFDQTNLDVLLQDKWMEMRDALGQGDIGQTLVFFSQGSKDRYRQIFEAIQDSLNAEAEGLQDIILVSFLGTTAKYRIQRDVSINGQVQTMTYWVYFIQDTDGIWRIKQF